MGDPAGAAAWAEQWLAIRNDLRDSSRARLVGVVRHHVIPAFGHRQLSTVGNAEIRAWTTGMAEQLSAASVRIAVFALRQMLDAAVADRRISVKPAASVPLPSESAQEQRFLTREQVSELADTRSHRGTGHSCSSGPTAACGGASFRRSPDTTTTATIRAYVSAGEGPFAGGAPNGIRTRATALKGRRPRPLDDGGWAS